jgi:hypothetical protein
MVEDFIVQISFDSNYGRFVLSAKHLRNTPERSYISIGLRLSLGL